MVTLASAAIVAAPWFILCWLRNGSAFWDDFFWKQHVARFLTPSLEHVQPFWYYIPVLLAGLFPWTPLAALLAQRRLYSDRRVLLLAAWVLYGLIFFSVARNKLPGYLLPLFPALAIVLAAALDTSPVQGLVAGGLCAAAGGASDGRRHLAGCAAGRTKPLPRGFRAGRIGLCGGRRSGLVARLETENGGRAAECRLGRWDRRRVFEVQHVPGARSGRFPCGASGELTRARFPPAVSTASAGRGSTA